MFRLQQRRPEDGLPKCRARHEHILAERPHDSRRTRAVSEDIDSPCTSEPLGRCCTDRYSIVPYKKPMIAPTAAKELEQDEISVR